MPAYITINKRGRFGNQLIQYMGALSIQDRIPDAVICDFALPEYGIIEPAALGRADRTIRITQASDFAVTSIARAAQQAGTTHIIIDDYCQDVAGLQSPEWYRTRIPIRDLDAPAFDDDHIVIQIRAEDVLSGKFDVYPVLPASFYADLISLSGKRPVFIGQLEDCAYVNDIRRRLPDAVFLPSGGPVSDFDTVRKSRNIAIAISTLSWAAAWLSEARCIFLPLCGWLNPSQLRHIDLVPVDDHRYRYFLFPVMFALPERRALEHHASIDRRWREISNAHVKLLKHAAPMLPPSSPHEPVMGDWYCHRHIDAAEAISAGLYADASHHYADIGRRLGYRPWPAVERWPEDDPLVSVGKSACQSSLASHLDGATMEAVAQTALDGDVFTAGARTAVEDDPWWMIDLDGPHAITSIHIYNVAGSLAAEAYSFPLLIETSLDRADWTTLLRMAPGETFGSFSGNYQPLVWRDAEPITARYVKVTRLGRWAYLELSQVEVFGTPV